jgi:hypothetical protein
LKVREKRLFLRAAVVVIMWGGVFAIAADLPMGMLMTFAYIWRRDLVANALAHSAGLLIGMAVM